MDFNRKKKRGESQKIRRYWLSSEGYRVTWRREVWGVQVPARFQACVRTIIPNYGGEEGKSFEMWDFVTKPRLYKTLKAAQEDCERHKRLWTKACEATGLRGLLEIFGKLPMGIPVWARKKLPRKVLEILTRPRTAKYQDECEPTPDNLTTHSDCSAEPTEPRLAVPAPASPAGEKDSSTIPVTCSASAKKDTLVTPVEEPAKALKKRAARRTSTRSKPARRSKPSAKKKSRQSKS